MGPLMTVIGIILIVFAVFLIIAVLMQQGKAHNLSGTIAGGAETFFGKSKAQTINKKLSILTTVVAIIFVILVVAVYVINADNDNGALGTDNELEDVVNEEEHDHDHDHEGEAADKDEADKDEAAGDKTEADKTEDSAAADTDAADDTAASGGTEN